MTVDSSVVGLPCVSNSKKNLPAMQETQGRSLGWEGPLEEGMATHSSVLAWRIPRTEEAGGLQSMGSQRVGHDWASDTTTDAAVGAEGLSPTLGRGPGAGPRVQPCRCSFPV